MIFPWQQLAWQNLNNSRGKFHHALLFYGPSGTGKKSFVESFARSLLCQNIDDSFQACGKCSDCLWFQNSTHPDYRLLMPSALRAELSNNTDDSTDTQAGEEKKLSNQITIQEIRALQDLIGLSTHRSTGNKVIIIQPADSMNVFAANALLKMLEEPPAKTFFLLVTDDLQRLLPTIISRCRRFILPNANKAESLSWLKEKDVQSAEVLLAQAGGAPLAALEIAETMEERQAFFQQLIKIAGRSPAVLDFAAQFQKMQLQQIIRWLVTWCYDLMAMKLTDSIRYHVDFHKEIQLIVKRVNSDALLIYQDHLKQSVKTVNHPLNSRLFLEQLLLLYSRIFQ